jgi:hypothetical protein
MTYWFKGFFAVADEAVLQAALNRWPFCTGKCIEVPFQGIGVRCPNRDGFENLTDEEWETLDRQQETVEKGLAEFSRLFPDKVFAFIHAECFGGSCEYAGLVVRNGAMLFAQSLNDQTEEPLPLKPLLEPLGTHLNNGYFAPFERGFWGEE